MDRDMVSTGFDYSGFSKEDAARLKEIAREVAKLKRAAEENAAALVRMGELLTEAGSIIERHEASSN